MVAFAEKSVSPLKTSNGVAGGSAPRSGYLTTTLQSDLVWTQKNNLQSILRNIGFPLLRFGYEILDSFSNDRMQKRIESLRARARKVGQWRLTNRLTHASHRLARLHGSRVRVASRSNQTKQQVAGSSSTRSLFSIGLTEAGGVCLSDNSDSWSECWDVTEGWTWTKAAVVASSTPSASDAAVVVDASGQWRVAVEASSVLYGVIMQELDDRRRKNRVSFIAGIGGQGVGGVGAKKDCVKKEFCLVRRGNRRSAEKWGLVWRGSSASARGER